MPHINPQDLPVREPRPGWYGRFFHSEHMTFAYYDIDAGADVHPHRHEQEEVFHVLDGELDIVVDGAPLRVRAGEAAVVPSGVEHSARAVRDSRVIVVDHPSRAAVGGVDIR